MKHILNNLTEEEKNSILEQHTGGKKIMIENFNKLINSKLGDSKPLMEQENSTEGKNNLVWKNLVLKLRNLSFPPRILTFDSYDDPPIPSQSLNWGTLKSPNLGNYAFGILTSDSKMPIEKISLFNSDDKKNQNEMYNWWRNKGYKVEYDYVLVDYKNADKLKSDIEEFFKVYPPEKK